MMSWAVLSIKLRRQKRTRKEWLRVMLSPIDESVRFFCDKSKGWLDTGTRVFESLYVLLFHRIKNIVTRSHPRGTSTL